MTLIRVRIPPRTYGAAVRASDPEIRSGDNHATCVPRCSLELRIRSMTTEHPRDGDVPNASNANSFPKNASREGSLVLSRPVLSLCEIRSYQGRALSSPASLSTLGPNRSRCACMVSALSSALATNSIGDSNPMSFSNSTGPSSCSSTCPPARHLGSRLKLSNSSKREDAEFTASPVHGRSFRESGREPPLG